MPTSRKTCSSLRFPLFPCLLAKKTGVLSCIFPWAPVLEELHILKDSSIDLPCPSAELMTFVWAGKQGITSTFSMENLKWDLFKESHQGKFYLNLLCRYLIPEKQQQQKQITHSGFQLWWQTWGRELLSLWISCIFLHKPVTENKLFAWHRPVTWSCSCRQAAVSNSACQREKSFDLEDHHDLNCRGH